jgi:hypothetical protein
MLVMHAERCWTRRIPLPEQIAQSAHSGLEDVTRRKNAEPHQVGEPERVVTIVGVLESCVLPNGRRVDELHVVARGHQAVDEPVPVVRRLDGDRDESLAVRLECFQDQLEIVPESPVEDPSIVGITDGEVAVVGVKIDTAEQVILAHNGAPPFTAERNALHRRRPYAYQA